MSNEQKELNCFLDNHRDNEISKKRLKSRDVKPFTPKSRKELESLTERLLKESKERHDEATRIV